MAWPNLFNTAFKFKVQVAQVNHGSGEAQSYGGIRTASNSARLLFDNLVAATQATADSGTFANISKEIYTGAANQNGVAAQFCAFTERAVCAGGGATLVQFQAIDTRIKAFFAAVIPEAPVSLSATVISWNEIDLSWTNVYVGTGNNHLERDDGMGFVEIATLDIAETVYKDQSIFPGGTFTYRIRCDNGLYYSAYTVNSEGAITLGDPNLLPEVGPFFGLGDVPLDGLDSQDALFLNVILAGGTSAMAPYESKELYFANDNINVGNPDIGTNMIYIWGGDILFLPGISNDGFTAGDGSLTSILDIVANTVDNQTGGINSNYFSTDHIVNIYARKMNSSLFEFRQVSGSGVINAFAIDYQNNVIAKNFGVDNWDFNSYS